MLPPNCLEGERGRRTHYKNKTIKHFLGKLAITTKSFDHTIARSHSIEDGRITVCMQLSVYSPNSELKKVTVIKNKALNHDWTNI
jgi:hypothetical protein